MNMPRPAPSSSNGTTRSAAEQVAERLFRRRRLVNRMALLLATSATLFGLSRWMPISVFAQNVVSMIGLGVGVDYAL